MVCKKLKNGNMTDRAMADRLAEIVLGEMHLEEYKEFDVLKKMLESQMKKKYGDERYARCLMNKALSEKQKVIK